MALSAYLRVRIVDVQRQTDAVRSVEMLAKVRRTGERRAGRHAGSAPQQRQSQHGAVGMINFIINWMSHGGMADPPGRNANRMRLVERGCSGRVTDTSRSQVINVSSSVDDWQLSVLRKPAREGWGDAGGGWVDATFSK